MKLMHSYRVCVVTYQGKRLAEHAFHCDYDIEALAKAGSLITAGQSAEVRSKAGLVGIVDAPA
jgi:hypothetical protein